MTIYTWDALLCADCWYEINPDRMPVRVKNDNWGNCTNCGNPTRSGIYIRRDPKAQKFPRVKVELD